MNSSTPLSKVEPTDQRWFMYDVGGLSILRGSSSYLSLNSSLWSMNEEIIPFVKCNLNINARLRSMSVNSIFIQLPLCTVVSMPSYMRVTSPM